MNNSFDVTPQGTPMKDCWANYCAAMGYKMSTKTGRQSLEELGVLSWEVAGTSELTLKGRANQKGRDQKERKSKWANGKKAKTSRANDKKDEIVGLTSDQEKPAAFASNREGRKQKERMLTNPNDKKGEIVFQPSFGLFSFMSVSFFSRATVQYPHFCLRSKSCGAKDVTIAFSEKNWTLTQKKKNRFEPTPDN